MITDHFYVLVSVALFLFCPQLHFLMFVYILHASVSDIEQVDNFFN